MQANGGWDVSCFCDPKENRLSGSIVNKWSQNDTTREIGNIPYAPFSMNQDFFEEHFESMLVINGIDSQTNAHTVGVTHVNSGRIARGYPTLGALYAKSFGEALPLSYITMGGFSDTADLLIPVVSQGKTLIDFAKKNTGRFKGTLLDRVKDLHKDKIMAQLQSQEVLPQNIAYQAAYLNSLNDLDQLEGLLSIRDSYPEIQFDGQNDDIITCLMSYKAGLTLAADFTYGSFDSHSDNDPIQDNTFRLLLGKLNFIFETAKKLQIEDQIILLLTSDFSRAPMYNAQGDGGKDHWSIGSYLIFEKGSGIGNRVVGGTDGLQNAFKINPNTLKIDTKGELLTPAHIHKELRGYLGIAGTNVDQLFPINVDNEVRFLS